MGARAFWVVALAVLMAAGVVLALSAGNSSDETEVIASPFDELSGSEGTGDSSENTLSPVDQAASQTDGEILGDLCDATPTVHNYLVEIGLLLEEDLAELPVPYDFQTDGWWEIDALGADGAYGVTESMTGGVWLCDLEVSPEVAAALAALEPGPDGTLPADKIVEIIEGSITDSDSTGDSDNSSGDDGSIPVLSPDELRQQVRDLINAAGTAGTLGDTDSQDSFMDLARDLYDAYGETVLDSTSDYSDVMDVAAGAQLLGMEDLANAAAQKLEELAEAEIAAASELFSACTEDENIINIYRQAVQRTTLILGTENGLWSAWVDVQTRRKNGEPIPECEGGLWISSSPLEGWDGTVDIQLESCGFRHWEGKLIAAGTLSVEGGTMTLQGEVPLEFDLLDAAAATTFQTPWSYGRPGTSALNIEVVVYVTLETEDATGDGIAQMSGAGVFEMTGEADWAELTIFFDTGLMDFTVRAAGMEITQSREIKWEERDYSAPIEEFNGLCDSQ